MLNERLSRMREKLWNTRPCITAEHLVLQTEGYKKFAGDAVPIFRAKVIRHIMENMTALILDDELIVGTATNKYRGANLFPEFQSASMFYIPDIDEFPVRKTDPYDIDPEDRDTILKILNEYWIGRSMEDLAQDALPPEIELARQEDLISVGLRNGVSGETTCDHEKLLTIGLKGYMDECRANIATTISGSYEDQAKIDFWKACIIQCEGLITYAHHMADQAELLAAQCTDEKRKRNCSKLQKTAASCLRILPRPSSRLSS